jgi:hypothetical protein
VIAQIPRRVLVRGVTGHGRSPTEIARACCGVHIELCRISWFSFNWSLSSWLRGRQVPESSTLVGRVMLWEESCSRLFLSSQVVGIFRQRCRHSLLSFFPPHNSLTSSSSTSQGHQYRFLFYPTMSTPFCHGLHNYLLYSTTVCAPIANIQALLSNF